MKKYLLLTIIGISLFTGIGKVSANAYYTIDTTAQTITVHTSLDYSNTLIYVVPDVGGNAINNDLSWGHAQNDFVLNYPADIPYGDYEIIFPEGVGCWYQSLANCVFSYPLAQNALFTLSPPAPQATNGITSMINYADSGFASSTGFSVSDITAWSSTNLIMLFLGSGLALLYNLRLWIVALVIIGAIVYFAYRAFRFFQH